MTSGECKVEVGGVEVPDYKYMCTCVKQSTCDLVNAKGSCLVMEHSMMKSVQ